MDRQMTDPREPQERAMLRDTVRSMLKSVDPIAEVRDGKAGEQGYSAANWQAFLSQLGAGGALVPEQNGGLGLDFGDVCAILEETGASSYNGPFLSSAVLATLVVRAADTDVDADLAALAEGATTAAVTGLQHGPDPAKWGAEVTATEGPNGWTLSGRASGVLHGIGAGILYVLAQHADGIGVWAVAANAAGHTARGLVTLDLTRRQSEHTFEQAPGRLVLSPAAGVSRLHAISSLATIALSAEQVGAAAQRLAVALEYARTRYQFGRAIGSFQAIKHRCVDMAIAVEGAKAGYESARDLVDTVGLGQCLTQDRPDVRRAAAIAGAWCSQACLSVAGASLQLHGGIGMAWEHDSHLYLRRAKASEQLFGDPIAQRRVLLATL
jgi:alkylation response protein AidB-like acyl-CoA dehydrogenase